MRKKYLSALLFGALLFASAGTFTSCKDYDDDINNLQEQINTINTTLSELKTLVGDGGVSSVTFDESTGVLTVVDANGTKAYTIKTAAGSVDEVKITIEGQELKVNGVTVGKVGDAVAVENGELTINGAATGIKVGEYSILDNQDAGTVTITLPDADGKMQTVVLMKAGAVLSYINVINADQEVPTFEALYDINKTDVEYSPYKKKLAAGLYTTLDRDLKIVVNPQSADASIYKFALKNSNGDDTELTFKPAQAYEGSALTAEEVTSRASSKNGIWVLENDYTRYDNNNLTDIRTNLYKKFKANDVESPYALTLQATNEETGTTFNTPYNLSAELRQMHETTAAPLDMQYTHQGEWVKPVVEVNEGGDESAIYDYWLTLEQSALNLQRAQLYGVEIDPVDGHSFRFTKEAGVGNEINLVYNYILVNGTIRQGNGDNDERVFTVEFAKELASVNTKAFDDLIKPFDAALASKDYKMYSGVPNGEGATTSATTFFMTEDEYDYSAFYNALSEEDKLVWNSAMDDQATSVSFELFGGEGGNNLDNKNKRLLQNIRYNIDTKNQNIGLQFLVDQEWEKDEQDFGKYNNFKLNTAYELVMTVKDPIANNVVAKLTFPFELQQPTMDIVPIITGDFSQWKNEGDNKEEVLYSYGAYSAEISSTANKMYIPFYESFKAWTKDGSYKAEDYDANAVYYKMKATGIGADKAEFMGTQNENELRAINPHLAYNADWTKWNTYMLKANGEEKSLNVTTEYYHYGVYKEDLFTNGIKNQFKLVFASLLKHSNLEMAEGSEKLTAKAGTNDVFISNDNLNFTTPMGDKFFLFDGIENGKVVSRANLNKESFNEAQRPFAEQCISVKAFDMAGNELSVSSQIYSTVNTHYKWKVNKSTGEVDYVLMQKGGDEDIKLYAIKGLNEVKDESIASGKKLSRPAGLAIELSDKIEDKQDIKIILTVTDALGFTNEVEFIVNKLGE